MRREPVPLQHVRRSARHRAPASSHRAAALPGRVAGALRVRPAYRRPTQAAGAGQLTERLVVPVDGESVVPIPAVLGHRARRALTERWPLLRVLSRLGRRRGLEETGRPDRQRHRAAAGLEGAPGRAAGRRVRADDVAFRRERPGGGGVIALPAPLDSRPPPPHVPAAAEASASAAPATSAETSTGPETRKKTQFVLGAGFVKHAVVGLAKNSVSAERCVCNALC